MSSATKAAAFALALIVAAGCSSSDPGGASESPDSSVGGSSQGTGGTPGSGGSSSGAGGAAPGSGGMAAGGTSGSAGQPAQADASADARPRDASNDAPIVSPEAAINNCIAGDPSQPMEFQVVYHGDAGFVAAAAAPAPIPLAVAPQGGQVLFVGVRVRNISGCSATINTALVDTSTATRAVVSLEMRPIFFELGSDGWVQPRQPTVLSNYSNLPACPRAGLLRSVDGQRYELQLSLTDAQGRTGQTTLNIVPDCGTGAAGAVCHCQCAQNYTLGMPCP